MLLVGLVRITATYPEVSQTIDESNHVAAGMEWLDQGTYQLHPINPPLARIFVALGPYLAGAPSVGSLENANDIFQGGPSYRGTLTLARLGTLPFFLAASILLAIWSAKIFGPPVAIVAVLLFTSMPPVLAHSGLGTTDVATVATVFGALFAFGSWLESPSPPRSLMLGGAVGLALLTRFSAIPFMFASGACVCVLHCLDRRANTSNEAAARRVRALGIGVCLVAMLVTWGGYQFSIGPLTYPQDRPHGAIDRIIPPGSSPQGIVYELVEEPIYPARELLWGLRDLYVHNSLGHDSYLLGEVSKDGWWYFFPVALFFKTPLSFWIMYLIGLIFVARTAWVEGSRRSLIPVAASPAILLCAIPSTLNLGLRYVLAVYPFLTMVAAYGIVRLYGTSQRRPWLRRCVASGLLVWYVLTTALYHPDYLAYFNELAGRHPERILVNSDLDWGQDVGGVAAKLREHNIHHVSLALFSSADLHAYGLAGHEQVKAEQRPDGWMAVSLYNLKVNRAEFGWLDDYEPVDRVGRSILLYHLPDERGEQATNTKRARRD
jgi:4-amino-4-deoxy-L-arabinose transferase-like glycosyltransferase